MEELDIEEVTKFAIKLRRKFNSYDDMYYFIIGFLTAKAYKYEVASDAASDITDDLWV